MGATKEIFMQLREEQANKYREKYGTSEYQHHLREREEQQQKEHEEKK